MLRADARRSALLGCGRVSLLWLVIVAAVYPFGHYHSNEYDRLPHARQFVEPDWLGQDWYLNRPGNPYQVFEAFLGPLVKGLGFQQGALVGRLVVYGCVALALNVFFSTLRLSYAWGLWAAFVFFRHQSLVAGEWIAGAVEAKTVAYALALMGMSCLARQRYRWGWGLTGAAMSLHILVGGYAVFCALAAHLLMTLKEKEQCWQGLRATGWVLLGAGFGLIHLLQRLALGTSTNSQRAGLIYVICRNPHHLLPLAWQKSLWAVTLLAATALFVWPLWKGRSRITKWVATYALASIVLFVFGLCLYALRLIPWLKYYWFRFGDVMVPLLGLSLLALGLQHWLHGRLRRGASPKATRHTRIRVGLIVLAVIVMTITLWQIWMPQAYTPPALAELNADIDPMLFWIRDHTEPNAVVLADPLLWDFYLKAQRAMFVSLKHVPNLDDDILAWFERLKLCNSGKVPEKPNEQTIIDLHHNFYQLTEQEINNIAQSYGLTYYLGRARQDCDLPVIHQAGQYVLYRIGLN